jgi:hypothetical protein
MQEAENETSFKERPSEILSTLSKEKDLDIAQISQAVLRDKRVMKEVLAGILAMEQTYRYNCIKVLLQISRTKPRRLYPTWDYFTGLLNSANAYHRTTAVQVLANMTGVDKENRFDGIFDPYFSLLDDEKVTVARATARNAGLIAKAKPHLQKRITRRLLDIDKTGHKQWRKDLIKADIIHSFEIYYPEADEKKRIITFVEKQTTCSSGATRKAAQRFLNKHQQYSF